MKVKCPTATSSSSIQGCGHEFEAEPDWEGLVDCPKCGIWFSPKREGQDRESYTDAQDRESYTVEDEDED